MSGLLPTYIALTTKNSIRQVITVGQAVMAALKFLLYVILY